MIRKSNGQPQPQSGASTTSNASSARSFFWGLWVYYRPKNAKDLPKCLEQVKNPGDVEYCVNEHTTPTLVRVTSPLTSRRQFRDPSESELKSESESKSKFESKLQSDLESKSKEDLEEKTDIAEKTDLDQKRDLESETEVDADAFGRSSSPLPFTTYYSDYHSPSIWGPGSYQLLNNNLSGQVYDDHCCSSLHGKE